MRRIRREELGGSFDARRRHILFGAMGVLIAACERPGGSQDRSSGPTPEPVDAPLSADFAFPNGQTVRLDYFDRKNFRLRANGQPVETIAVDGAIYLHIRPGDGRADELWRSGSLDWQPRPSPVPLPKTRPTLIPPQGVAHWGVATDVYDVTANAEGSPGLKLEATIAKIPDLAHAQWVVATSLLPAMDMSLCGDAVQQVTRSWNADLTGQGWAVLATSDGFRLDGPVGKLESAPSLPEGVTVRDLPAL